MYVPEGDEEEVSTTTPSSEESSTEEGSGLPTIQGRTAEDGDDIEAYEIQSRDTDIDIVSELKQKVRIFPF